MQVKHKKSLTISIVLTAVAILRIQTISNFAAIALLIETSLLTGLLLQKLFKSKDTVLSTTMGCFAVLIVVGGVLGSIGILTFNAILLSLAVLSISINFISLEFPEIVRPKNSVLPIVLISSLGVILAVGLRYFSPYPIQIDTDVTKEAIRIGFIGRSGVAPILLPGDFRPVLYDTMLSIVSILIGIQGSDVVWYAVFATFPLYGIGILLLARRFFHDWLRATTSAFFGLLICGFWYLEGPAIVLPETFAAIVTLYVLALYLDWNPTGLKSLVIFIALLVFFDIGYYYAVAAVIPFVGFLQIWPVRRLGNNVGVAVLLVTLASAVGALILFGNTIGSQMTSVDLSFVDQFMLAAYTPLLLSFILVGIIFTLFVSRDKALLPVIGYGLFVLVMLVVPIAYTTRIEIFGRPELAMMGSMGLVGIVSLVSNRQSRKGLALVCLLVLVSTPVLIMPYESWFTATVQVPPWHGLSLETFSLDEGNAGLWLRKNASQGFIISDLESSAIMQSISGLPGVYNPILFLNNLTLLNLTYSALNSNSSSISKKYLNQISTHEIFYFVITSRTEASIKEWKSLVASNSFTLDSAQDLVVNYPTSDPLLQDPLFGNLTLVYSNPTAEIYKS